ncbi:MAG: sugar ABC transporter permease [Salana multivorans]|uniref:carbohydrate ABC transporter permease n=1 Tax=Salana multivorans TaxID=120377 RepID=UPI00096598C6|nr:sugar ABC transporter permease [Salana multivorans]MBN8883545.1 sugar ABC transporter permease [Salana multivorans]OJX94002.1 MAG: sugar transporter [Micrococcales bacterium 73-15]
MTLATSTAPGVVQAPPAPRRRRGRGLYRTLAPYLFVTPFLAFFVAFGVYPMLFALQLSFTDWRGAGTAQWVGWDNYLYLLQNPAFWSSLATSGALWLMTVPVQILVGTIAAVILNNTLMRGRGLARSFLLLPFVTPLVAMAQVWIITFDQNHGAVNAFLGLFGLPDIGWLTTTVWAKPTIALLFLWKTTGFAVIILLAGLQAIPGDVYEAAALDGASHARQLWEITLPLLRRTTAFLVVMQTLAVFQMFAEPFMLTQGGPYGSTTTAGYNLYKYIRVSDLGTGAANSFLLVVIVVLLSLATIRFLRPKD